MKITVETPDKSIDMAKSVMTINCDNDEQERYRQVIVVPEYVTRTVFDLPCIYSCHKEADDSIVYLLRDWDELGHYVEARPGQSLCECYDGRWEVKDKV